MAEFDRHEDASTAGKSRFSLAFNRSVTMQAKPATADPSNPKINLLLNSSFNRASSVSRFYNSIESVVTASNSLKGKVKKLCNIFESSKAATPIKSGQSQPQQQLVSKVLRPSKTIAYSSFPSYGTSCARLPGTEDRIVVYLTSLRGIRRTYEDCYAVKMIFRGFRVWVDERDMAMDAAYRKELQSVLGEKNISLPQVFIRGRHVGGADVIKSMFEMGELAKILEGLPRRDPGFVCDSCGDIRFVPCGNCSGSRKVFDEDEGLPKRCLECNENGLIRCPECGTKSARHG